MNRGSATLKCALYEAGTDTQLLVSVTADMVNASGVRLRIADPSGVSLFDGPVEGKDSSATLKVVFAWLDEHKYLSGLVACGHRLVHGGPRFREPQRITPEFLSEIKQLIPLDPDHLPEAIQGIQFIARKFPTLPQVACFDTAFHSSLPRVARMYALPRRLYEQGILRYGFHGLSYESILGQLTLLGGKLAAGRIIIAHLGSGASMVAIKDGKSLDTSMGFTPLEGLVMSTRSGDVDPGALLYLLAEEKLSAKEINTLLNKESGLMGVSGMTGDMRELLNKAPHNARAAEAVDLFCYRAKKYLGAFVAVLGGLDLLVFTGGIGEHAPAIRERICSGLNFLGIRLDASRNGANAPLISSPDSPVSVRIIQTNEDLMIARHAIAVLDQATPRTN